LNTLLVMSSDIGIIREVIRSRCSEFRDEVMETWYGSHNFRIRLRGHSENQSKPWWSLVIFYDKIT
jgi:hypothetical protein